MKCIPALLVMAMSLSSCYHVYYAPNTANTPLFSEKGEARINALYAAGGDSEFQGGELQFAYAPAKNVGFMVNGFAGGKSENTGDYYEKGNGSYGEVAIGYFSAMDQRKRWIGEIYGGIGLGTANNDYGMNDRSKVNSTKLFMQPAVGFKTPNFEVAFAPRLSLVNWKVKENNITHQENSDATTDLNYIRGESSFFAFEPALILRGGGETVKFQGALSFSNHHASSFYEEGLTETLTASIGVSFNIKPGRKAK